MQVVLDQPDCSKEGDVPSGDGEGPAAELGLEDHAFGDLGDAIVVEGKDGGKMTVAILLAVFDATGGELVDEDHFGTGGEIDFDFLIYCGAESLRSMPIQLSLRMVLFVVL